MNPNYQEINAQSQIDDENSVFHYYKKLIHLRKENSIFVDGDFTLLLPEDENIFAYVREYEGRKLLVAGNFTDQEVSCESLELWKSGKTLIRNYKDEISGTMFRPYEAFIKLF